MLQQIQQHPVQFSLLAFAVVLFLTVYFLGKRAGGDAHLDQPERGPVRS